MNSELKEKLARISRVFDIKEITTLHFDKKYIQEYYQINRIPYSVFHTRTGLIHMGISRDGIYKEDDLLEQSRIVEQYIHRTKAQRVLELATGRGGNSVRLAKRHGGVSFYGIDMSQEQLNYAFERAKEVHNYHPILGDFHDLGQFEKESFDVIFVVEALCHSTTKERVFSEILRVLKTGGTFIIFDGYLQAERAKLSGDEGIAVRLFESGMALEPLEEYRVVRDKLLAAQFVVEEEEELSLCILPTLTRFEKKAHPMFAYPLLGKALLHVLPTKFLYNAVTGYIGATLVKSDIVSYWVTVARKS